MEKFKELIESLGWGIDDIQFGGNETGWDLHQFTPLGEDWYMSIAVNDDIATAIESIKERNDNFDVNEEASFYIENRGQNGIPSSVQALLDDAEWKGDQIEKLYNAVVDFNESTEGEDKMVESKKVTEARENDVEKRVSQAKEWKKKVSSIKEIDDLEELADEVLEATEDIKDINFAGEDLYNGFKYVMDDDDAYSRSEATYIRSVKRNMKDILDDFINDYKQAYEEESLEENKKVTEASEFYTDDAEKVYDIVQNKMSNKQRLEMYRLATGGTLKDETSEEMDKFWDWFEGLDSDEILEAYNDFKTIGNQKITEADETIDENTQVNNIIDELKEKDSLWERVIEEIVEDSDNYGGNTLKENIMARCEDIGHGLSTGIVGSLIYNNDIVEFFEKYNDELYNMVEDYDLADYILEKIQRDNDTIEILFDKTIFAIPIVWGVYETIASDLYDRLYELGDLEESKKITETNKTEDYWDAKEIARRGFTSLMKFNFGFDSKGNNYIITNDNTEIKRFKAKSDKEAEEIFNQN